MQNVSHITQNTGHTTKNDGCTMQHVGCTTLNVGRNKLNICQGSKGGWMPPSPTLEKTLVSRNDF